MNTDAKPFPLVDLKGSWRAMGEQYGEECKEEIAHMAKWWDEVLQAHHPKFDRDYAHTGALSQYENAICKYASRWIDFMHGIAKGAGLPYETVFWINTSSNVLEGPEWALRDTGGCTSLAIEPERTDMNKTILGQNLDWHSGCLPIAMRFAPDDAPRVLAFGFAGACPQLGISEKGFGTVINTIGRKRNKAGVPMQINCAEPLFAPGFSDACYAIVNCDRAMSFNHMIASKDGSMVDFEVTVEEFGVVEERNGRIIHANHFLTPRLQEGDVFRYAPDTFIRCRRAEKIIDAAEKVGIDTIKQVFTDHHGDRSASICCHPEEGMDFTETWSTVLSVIEIPEDGVIYATHNPCENEYVEYRL